MKIEKWMRDAALEVASYSDSYKNCDTDELAMVIAKHIKPHPILFDGYAVLQEIRKAGHGDRTGADNVSDVLDAVVMLMRREP